MRRFLISLLILLSCHVGLGYSYESLAIIKDCPREGADRINDRIELLPEKKHYEPGETARFLVRMPFRSAVVLVTVEREGVMDAYVKNLEEGEPVFEIPMKGKYAPDVFVSALVIRGPTSEETPAAFFDAGGTALKLGIAEIKVGNKAYDFKMAVAADKRAYNVRKTSKVLTMVKKTNGKFSPKGSEAVVAASTDLTVLSRLPKVVREDDTFRADFTVRNTSGRAMEVEIGAATGAADKKDLEPIRLELTPCEAKEIGWDIRVPMGIDRLQYEVTAKEIGGTAIGGIKVQQRVAGAIPARVFQSVLTQIDGSYSLSVEKPHDALKVRGDVAVTLKPKLAGALNGVISYMKRYQYTCMEQKVSRSIALRDGALWRNVVTELPSFMDGDGLVKYFPSMQHGSDVLTSYILSISDEAGWSIPASERYKMEEGLKKFIDGKIVRDASLSAADLSIRKVGALEALARAGKAEARMMGSITLEPRLWPTSAVLSWTNVLLLSPSLPDRDKLLKEAEQIIRSRINFQGTTMGFSTEAADNISSLMVSGDFNAVKSITTLLHFEDWKHDMPRLVRGSLDRQQQGRWALTTANAWGVLAMEKFSRMFESTPVTGSTIVAINSNEESQKWLKYPDGKTLRFPLIRDRTELVLRHDGKGKPWAMVQSSVAIPLKEPFSGGYKISKTLIPVESRTAGIWSKGDVVRVRLEAEARSDKDWVVISDPIPPGAEILGTVPERVSKPLANDEKQLERLRPVFEEHSSEAFRVYYEFVPQGKWVVEYTMKLNDSGTFHFPPTRVEAFYSPEMSGEVPNNTIEVAP